MVGVGVEDAPSPGAAPVSGGAVLLMGWFVQGSLATGSGFFSSGGRAGGGGSGFAEGGWTDDGASGIFCAGGVCVPAD